MAEREIIIEAQENAGEIVIANDVILSIAAQAINEIKGVSLSSSVAEGIVDMLVKKSGSKGMRVYLDETGKTVDIDVHIAILYGTNIPEISWTIQEAVKKNVESMTDVSVNKVNVFVDNVTLEKEPKPEKPKKVKPDKKKEEAPAEEN